MNIRQEVTLYLNGQQVDLNDNGGIYFNYKQKDVKNPTIVKNSFSKTLTIPGTDNNDNIFNNIWDLTRVQTTDIVPYFNQSKRVQFELFLNGELIEQGYAKLDRIRRNKVTEYDLSLYGSLGDFFYGLAFDPLQGTKKTLASLDFGEDLSFTINKETVKENWDELASGQTPTIAFAPMYNGIPSIIDAGKTLVNTSGYTGMTRYNKGDGWYEMPGFMTSYNFDEYKTIDRFALAEGVELSEWQTRDLRSYMQRPCLHVPALFDAISNPDNNGSYEVFLDPDFFNSGNSYYQQAYITLPMINELDSNKEEITSAITGTNEGSAGDSTSVTNISLTLEPGWNKYSVSVNLIAQTNETAEPYLYTSQRISEDHGSIMGGFAMQLIGVDVNGAEVAGGNIVWMTTMGNFDPNGDQYAKYEDVKYGSLERLKYTDTVDYSFGNFIRSNTGFYTWSETGLVLNLETNVVLSGFKIRIVPGCYVTRRSVAITQSHIGKVWSATTATTLTLNCYTLGFNVYLNSITGTKTNKKASYSNVEVSQEVLLNTEYTPADYLLSYCKLFNLYFDKDISNKVIRILTPKNFYDKDVDLSDDIDRSIDIEPLSFSHKWYSFNYKTGKGELIDAYKERFGTDFGQMRVNTGFEFDSETEELLKDNVFKNAVDYLPSNKYFIQSKDENGVILPNFLLDNVTYYLYNNDMDTVNVQVGLSRKGSYSSINTKSTETIQYDSFNKVQFCDGNKPVDGANVLLFFNGVKETIPYYWITDDLSYMFQLNDKPTWLWTAIENDANGNQIAIRTNNIPQFSRYIMDDEYIYASWDFGRTKELFIPEISYIDGNATLYERYWRAYIQDLYDIDTRIVTAYIQFDEKPTKESLKHFYYFEGSYWVIDEIIDYNPTSYELTKVKFVKVNDKANYLNNNIVPPGPGPVVKQFEFRPEGIMVNSGAGSTSTTLLVSGYEVIEWTIPTQSWATITRNGNTVSITYTANPDTTQRSFSIGVAGRDGSEIVTTIYSFAQRGAVIPDTVSIKAPSPIAATATTLTYSVTASKDVSVELLPDHTVNRHSAGTTLGSFTIPANTASTAQYYSVVASLVDDPTITDSASITQDGVSVYVTGISLSSNWATDVPYTGGTATYQNCNNVVTAYYSDGTSADITSQASFTASTSLNVPSTTSTTRDSVGVISVIASYYDGPNPFTSTVVVTAYQEAYVPPTPTGQTWTASNAGDYNIYGNLLDPSGVTFAGVELAPREDEVKENELPQTIAEVWLAVYGLDVQANCEVWVYNGRTGEEIIASYVSGNDFVGTGSIEIRENDYINFVVRTETRARAQVEPEPDETEETPGTNTE